MSCGGGNQKFDLGYVKFKMLIGNTSAEFKKAIGYRNLEFKGENHTAGIT